MGFLNGKIIKTETYSHLDLNEKNVNELFSQCLTSSKDYSTIRTSNLFPKRLGYQTDDKAINFDKNKIFENEQRIKFLLGQLQTLHDHKGVLLIGDVTKKYNGTIWTTDTASLMKFLHLCEASSSISPFIAAKKSATLYTYEPTLSPKDPKFAEWYKGYEAKMKKTEGPTPDEK